MFIPEILKDKDFISFVRDGTAYSVSKTSKGTIQVTNGFKTANFEGSDEVEFDEWLYNIFGIEGGLA